MYRSALAEPTQMRVSFVPRKVYTGGFDTEGYAMCITQDNLVYAWGNNNACQLGQPLSTQGATEPMLCDLKNVNTLALGRYHTLVLTLDGIVLSFGDNRYYQLGTGESPDYRYKPVVIEQLNDKNIVQIAAGGYHSFALTSSGKVYGWGWNAYQQLGIQESVNVSTPVLIDTLQAYTIKSISCGWIHSYFITGS
jgi:alpha-tubulin suppressor-like RCC1 family protein